MATHKSAEKRNRQNKVRRDRNISIKSKVKTSVKKVLGAVDKKDAESSKTVLHATISTIDKAVSKGVLHKNTASRKISRLTKKVNKLNA